eukprot:483387_1
MCSSFTRTGKDYSIRHEITDWNLKTKNKDQFKFIEYLGPTEMFEKNIEITSWDMTSTINNLMDWECLIIGPKNTAYQNGKYKLKIHLTNSYPYGYPSIKFINPPYCCNIIGYDHNNKYFGSINQIFLDLLQSKREQYSYRYRVHNIIEELFYWLFYGHGVDPKISNEEISTEFNYYNNSYYSIDNNKSLQIKHTQIQSEYQNDENLFFYNASVVNYKYANSNCVPCWFFVGIIKMFNDKYKYDECIKIIKTILHEKENIPTHIIEYHIIPFYGNKRCYTGIEMIPHMFYVDHQTLDKANILNRH